MRTEATVWGAALMVGLSFGIWQAVTASAPVDVPAMSQLSVVMAPAEQPTVLSHEPAPPRNIAVSVGSWLVDRLARFVRVAWWALPVPLLFSLWRQFARRPTCARCASRRIVAAELFLPGGTP